MLYMFKHSVILQAIKYLLIVYEDLCLDLYVTTDLRINLDLKTRPHTHQTGQELVTKMGFSHYSPP